MEATVHLQSRARIPLAALLHVYDPVLCGVGHGRRTCSATLQPCDVSIRRQRSTTNVRLSPLHDMPHGVVSGSKQIATKRMTHFCFGFRDPGFKFRTGHRVSWLGFNVGFLNHSTLIPGQHLKLFYSRLLPNSFPFNVKVCHPRCVCN